ncbi:SMI1/KNR4 family protein [Marinagarivorans algicola]|uniref:SMI1/KNR4 family protein n=1 Tax=Marinagarivorans algicola TaxID=1513270 RepID=UPI0006B69609|nr:SMI1/KNR4 family protein [Marinagarivorans algicola]
MADKNSVLPLLQAAHQSPVVALELPEDDEITAIEEAIYVQIRGDYRDFLLTASDLVIGALEPATVTDPHSHTYLPELTCHAWEQGLSRELLPICQSANGYFCLDMEDQIIEWIDGQIEPGSWPSIWSWAADVWLDS